MYSPLVTVLTPVYNGEKYLAECIESVCSQDYKNWEYIIINNCSTDSTLDIATRYADIDSRIRVVNNQRFVSMIENHNIAFSLVPPESKYCKVVSADDRIAPECLTEMVRIAEAHPTVGIVGSYQLSDSEVRWKGLPHDREVISGREVCRLSLVDKLDVFGMPTSTLFRSDLIRKNQPFFPHLLPHADTSACYKYLQDCDFGFSHEVLCIERVHDGQVTSKVTKLSAKNVAFLETVVEYGPIYLTESEFKRLKSKYSEEYYRWLGGCVLKLQGKEFWKYHASRMRKLGHPIVWRRVIKCAMDEILREIQNPRVAFHKVLSVLKEKY
jgi:glycosyltransferase involved in cell wall biosynthesis